MLQWCVEKGSVVWKGMEGRGKWLMFHSHIERMLYFRASIEQRGGGGGGGGGFNAGFYIVHTHP